MINLMEDIEGCKLEKNQMAIVWLAQAGFLLKQGEEKIVVDPYLSHYGEKAKGFIRMSPIIISAEKLKIDHYITTHKHFDHYDYETIPQVDRLYDIKFYGPRSCVEEFEKIKGRRNEMRLLSEGDKLVIGEDKFLIPVYADHGELEPDAVGLNLLLQGINVYITGDTSYKPERWSSLKDSGIDLMIASINGKFGNLNHKEGADLAKFVKAKSIIPCHFWTFKEHGGEPDLFEGELKKINCPSEVSFLTPGEIYILEKKDYRVKITKYKK